MNNPPYFDNFKNLAFSRDEDGVLLMRFHTDDGPIVFTGENASGPTRGARGDRT